MLLKHHNSASLASQLLHDMSMPAYEKLLPVELAAMSLVPEQERVHLHQLTSCDVNERDCTMQSFNPLQLKGSVMMDNCLESALTSNSNMCQSILCREFALIKHQPGVIQKR